MRKYYVIMHSYNKLTSYCSRHFSKDLRSIFAEMFHAFPVCLTRQDKKKSQKRSARKTIAIVRFCREGVG